MWTQLIQVQHDSFVRATWLMQCATWLIHMCDMTHLCVRRDSFVRATWLIYMCDMTHLHVRHDSFICATWPINMCNMTHSYVQLYSFVRVTSLICTCDMTHSYVRHDSFIYVTLLIHMCDVTQSYVRHDSFTRVTWCEYLRLLNKFSERESIFRTKDIPMDESRHIGRAAGLGCVSLNRLSGGRLHL